MTSDLDSPAAEPQVPAAPEPDETPNFRYPGSPPFRDTELDRLLFKGRNNEADEVLHSILSSDLFLLYAVSGMGKTSLLNAGVLHHLRDREFWPVSLRLNKTDDEPITLIREAVTEAADRDDDVELMSDPSKPDLADADNLWDYLSALEIWRGNTLLQPVLIFDQFEELFTLGWDEAIRNKFISQFGEVARGHRTDDRGTPTTPPSVKLVIVIREDALGELEAMAQHVPQILRQRFRLGPLDPQQARDAICEPALVEHPLLGTRRFAYSDAAADEILHFLGAKASDELLTGGRGVDPSQLQLVCQYVERTILPRKQPTEDDSRVEITADDLGGREGLEEILRDFYRRTIDLFDGEERRNVRELCEQGLINSSGRRLSREVGEITADYRVGPAELERLVTERLLRGEHRVGSVYYELAHDTLVAPIVEYRRLREAEALAAARERKRRRNRRVAYAAGALVLVAGLVLLITRPWQNDPIRLVIGEQRSDSIRSGQTIEYTFESTDERGLDVFVVPDPTGPSTADAAAPYLTLTVADPTDTVRQIDVVGDGGPESLILGGGVGDYQIAVRGSDESEGTFDIGVRNIDPAELRLGEPTSATIDQPGAVQAYTLSTRSEDEILVIDVTPGPEFDVAMEVIAPDGSITLIDEVGDGSTESANLRGLAGDYQVVVRGFQNSAGPFDIVARDVVELEIDTETAGAVDAGGVAVFSVQADGEDEILSIDVQPDPELAVALEVTAPDGSVSQIDDFGFGGTESVLLKDLDGEYQIIVKGFNEADAPSTTGGSFSIAVRPIETVPLEEDVPARGTIDVGGVAVFTIQADGDQYLAVDVVPEPGLDVTLEVTTPDGSIGQLDDANTEGGTETVLLRGAVGEYRLVVRGFGESTGSFDVVARAIEPVALEIGTPITTSVDDGGVAVFTVEAAGGNEILAAGVTTTAGPEVTFEATGPDGSVITTNGISGSSTAILRGLEGQYEFVVRAADRSDDTSDPSASFGIGVERVEPVRLAVGRGTSATFTRPVGVEVFIVEPDDADDILAVDVDPDSGLDVALEVIVADGPARQTNTGAAGMAESALLFGGSPQFGIVVTGFSESGGSFDIGVRRIPPTELQPETPAQGTIGAPGEPSVFAAYSLEVPAGGDLVVTATPAEATTDLVLEVADPTGERRVQDGASEGGEKLNVPDAAAGRWSIVVRGFQGATGDFEIVWR